MMYVCAFGNDVVKLATPSLMPPDPRMFLPLTKFMTAPSGTGGFELIVAVNVTDSSITDGLGEDVTAITVGALKMLGRICKVRSGSVHLTQLPVTSRSGLPFALRSAMPTDDVFLQGRPYLSPG